MGASDGDCVADSGDPSLSETEDEREEDIAKLEAGKNGEGLGLGLASLSQLRFSDMKATSLSDELGKRVF